MPLKPIDFAKPETITQHQAQLVGIFRDLGAAEMVERVLHVGEEGKTLTEALAMLDKKVESLVAAKSVRLTFAVAQQMYYAEAKYRDAALAGLTQQYSSLAAGERLPAIDDPQGPVA